MKSIALFQYPYIVFEKGRKKLWNPIQRKRLANRPEERVRLQIIDHLVRSVGWSPHRITTEIPVSLAISDIPNRADILCYNDDFEPRLLIECKAESVKISEKTGLQIGRYNTRIKAPYLMVSNGRIDYLFEVTGGKVENRSELSILLTTRKKVNEDRDFDYWADRGFAGHDASPELRMWLHQFLPAFWSNSPAVSDLSDPMYLQMAPLPNKLPIDHYYRILDYKEDVRLAFTFLATPHGGTRIIVILNRSGDNIGLLVINPGLLLVGQTPNAFVYNQHGEQGMDLTSHLPKEKFYSEADASWISLLADMMLKLH